MATVGFLHTAQVHVATFEALAQAEHLDCDHQVRADWLEQAQQEGLSAALTQHVKTELEHLARRCDVVICTCSTLGGVATQLGTSRVFRVDSPMMEQAAQTAGTPLLAYCLESTRETSRALLSSALTDAGRTPTIAYADCSSAWGHFEAQNGALFGETIAAQIKNQLNPSERSKTGCVILAQASMAAAVPYLQGLNLPVLTSPSTAVRHAARLLDS